MLKCEFSSVAESWIMLTPINMCEEKVHVGSAGYIGYHLPTTTIHAKQKCSCTVLPHQGNQPTVDVTANYVRLMGPAQTSCQDMLQLSNMSPEWCNRSKYNGRSGWMASMYNTTLVTGLDVWKTNFSIDLSFGSGTISRFRQPRILFHVNGKYR
jgi:hypothetical protein